MLPPNKTNFIQFNSIPLFCFDTLFITPLYSTRVLSDCSLLLYSALFHCLSLYSYSILSYFCYSNLFCSHTICTQCNSILFIFSASIPLFLASIWLHDYSILFFPTPFIYFVTLPSPFFSPSFVSSPQSLSPYLFSCHAYSLYSFFFVCVRAESSSPPVSTTAAVLYVSGAAGTGDEAAFASTEKAARGEVTSWHLLVVWPIFMLLCVMQLWKIDILRYMRTVDSIAYPCSAWSWQTISDGSFPMACLLCLSDYLFVHVWASVCYILCFREFAGPTVHGFVSLDGNLLYPSYSNCHRLISICLPTDSLVTMYLLSICHQKNVQSSKNLVVVLLSFTRSCWTNYFKISSWLTQ